MSDTTIVRFGDTHDVTWTVNADLTGATVTGYLRPTNSEGVWTQFDVVVETPGQTTSVVKHELTGTLPVGRYALVLKAEIQGRVASIPTDRDARLNVIPNAD